jgi:hypothetical protein
LIRRKNKEKIGNINAIQLHRGQVVGVLSKIPLTRYNLFAYADVIGSDQNIQTQNLWGTMVFVPDTLFDSPGGSLRELLDLKKDVTNELEKREIEKIFQRPDLIKIDMDKVLDEKSWKALPKTFRCHLLLDIGARTEGDILLVEHNVLLCAQGWFIKKWWESIANRFVIVRHTNPETIGEWGEKHAIAIRNDRSTVLMSTGWAKNNTNVLKSWFDKWESKDDPKDNLSQSDSDEDD